MLRDTKRNEVAFARCANTECRVAPENSFSALCRIRRACFLKKIVVSQLPGPGVTSARKS